MPKQQPTGFSLANPASRLKILIMMAVVLAAIGLFQASSAQDEVAFNNQSTRTAVTTGMDFEHRKPMVYGNVQRTIDTGMHIENIYQLSLKDKTFWADGWYWIKWRPEVQKIIEAEKIPLNQVLEFTNEIEATNMVLEPDTTEPVKLDDGRLYQLFRFSGHFFVNDLKLAGFPFYDMNLPITIETRPDSLSCHEGGPPCASLLPEKNMSNTLIGQFADVNGYDMVGSLVKPFLHQYNTNFGIGNPSAFPSIDYGIVYKTNFLSAFSQYILPLLVVIGIVIASPSLPGSLGDVRLAIPTTALLTLIFLQQSYRADLPPLSYTTFLDLLYIYAYLASIIFFFLFCWGTVYYNNASEGGELLAAQHINRIDWKFQLAALISLALLVPLAFVLL
ncbi:MAG: hypothetical protein NTW51_09380 [Cyanobacteria bacterium]|nr:hypothetical protein [Cyanobacteriota bacterium]